MATTELQAVDENGVVITFENQEDLNSYLVEQEVQNRLAAERGQSPTLGTRDRRLVDIKVTDLDIDWNLTQYAVIAKGEAWDDFYLSDLQGLAGLPQISLDNLDPNTILNQVKGIDWQWTNYSGLDPKALNTKRVGDLQGPIIIDPMIKDLPSIKGSYLENNALIVGQSPLPINEDTGFYDAMMIWAESNLDETELANFKENFVRGDDDSITVAEAIAEAQELTEATRKRKGDLPDVAYEFEEMVEDFVSLEPDELEGLPSGGAVATIIRGVKGLDFGNENNSAMLPIKIITGLFDLIDGGGLGDPDQQEQQIEGVGPTQPRPRSESPLRFSDYGTGTQTIEEDVKRQDVIDAMMDLTETEQKILAENIFLNMPDVYGSWEDIYNDDNSLNMDTFVPAFINALNFAETAAAIGQSDEYIEMFLIDDLTQLEKNDIRNRFQQRIAELIAIDNSKNVSLTDPATIAKQIDNKFKEVTGRGATDEDVRAFTELFYDLQREATPTVKEIRERGEVMGQERLGTLDLTARAEQYAEEQAPVEAGAMQTANKAGLIMQALGFGG